MDLKVVPIKKWQSIVLNTVAWVIGIKGEDVWCMTLTKGAIDEYKKEKELEAPKPRVSKKDVYKGDAYCVKCKDKKYFTGVIKTSDSGRRMAQGKCSDCGTSLNRILGKAQ